MIEHELRELAELAEGYEKRKLREAADEIERLNATIERVRKLEPRQLRGVSIEPYILGYADGISQAHHAIEEPRTEVAIMGVGRVASERERHISEEGRTPEHDTEHRKEELPLAASNDGVGKIDKEHADLTTLASLGGSLKILSGNIGSPKKCGELQKKSKRC